MRPKPRLASSLLEGTDVICLNGQKVRLAHDVNKLKFISVYPFGVGGHLVKNKVPIALSFVQKVFSPDGRHIEIIHEG